MSLAIGRLINFEPIIDKRGSLIALEGGKNLPIEIKRIYYLYNLSSDYIRGSHAHKDLRQVMVAISGGCQILLDNGKEKEIIELNRKDIGLYIPEGVWRELYNFSKDCIIMVFASAYYNEEDYIREYKDFLKYLDDQQEKI